MASDVGGVLRAESLARDWVGRFEAGRANMEQREVRWHVVGDAYADASALTVETLRETARREWEEAEGASPALREVHAPRMDLWRSGYALTASSMARARPCIPFGYTGFENRTGGGNEPRHGPRLHRDRGWFPRGQDLVLAPNEFAFISDETKGNINVYVGPHKTSLANTDQPGGLRLRHQALQARDARAGDRRARGGPEGWYLVLKNPARDSSHPRTGALNNLPELDVGRKVNTPGPVSYALWPGQMVKVVPGHSLRSNQYLLVRVYDEEAAKTNWAKAVIKRQTTPGGDALAEATEQGVLDPSKNVPELTMGKHLVIRGTDVSFYIPPTGIDVVADEQGKYVRDAVTLERLEYTILLDEDGNKRFIQGPAVVFPRPTETFIERNGSRKFRAIELTEIAGVYVKVIAPYEENGRAYKVGDELFITGREQMIYFPRPSTR